METCLPARRKPVLGLFTLHADPARRAELPIFLRQEQLQSYIHFYEAQSKGDKLTAKMLPHQINVIAD